MKRTFFKVVTPHEFAEPSSTLALVGSRGVDKDWLHKRAADDVFAHADIKPERGHSYIHVIALGDAEAYGCNRNGDAFYGSGDRRIVLPHPKDPNVPELHIKKGNEETHHTFVEHAKVYRDHRRFSPDPIGEVVASAHNRKMQRVELMLKVPDDVWEGDLQKLAEGRSVPFSMACTPDLGLPILTSRGYRPLGEIAPGDLVLGPTSGKWCRVLKRTERPYTGYILEFALPSVPYTYAFTSDHLLMVGTPHPGINEEPLFDIGWAHVEHLGTGRRAVFCRVRLGLEGEQGFSLGEARLLGAYDGGGMVSGGRCLLRIPDEVISRQVRSAILELDPAAEIRDREGVLEVHSLPVVERVLRHQSGELWRLLYTEYWIASEYLKARALAPNGLHTRSLAEALLLRDLLVIQGPVGFMTSGTGFELIPEILSVPPQDIKTADKCWLGPLVWKNFRYAENEMVYNLEVEDEHAYLAAGIVSHNCKVPYDYCSICGNQATKRAEYCEHLSKHMTALTPSGHRVQAINDHMDFIDISRVSHPADRIAWGLYKAASEGTVLSGAALAEYYLLQKEAASSDSLVGKLAALEKQIEALGILPEGSELFLTPEIPRQIIERFSRLSAEEKEALLAYLARLGICLSLRDFYTLLMGPDKASQIAAVLEKAGTLLPGIYSRMGEDAGTLQLQPGPLPDDVRELADTLYVTHSMDFPALRKRAADLLAEGNFRRFIPLKKAARGDDISLRFAEEYARYKAKVVGLCSDLAEILVRQNYL